MQFLNRSIVIIKPKQPFLDWITATDTKTGFTPTLEQIRSNPTSILIPEFDDPEDAIEYLKKIYDEIWHWTLFGYWTDEKAYPESRTYNKFQEWFDIEFGSEVIDFVDGKIKKEEV